VRVRYDEYDVYENGSQDLDGEYNCEKDTMTMLAIFVTLALFSVCQKQLKDVPYDEYDVNEENGGENPGGEYNCK
jgi:hypothetical protein